LASLSSPSYSVRPTEKNVLTYIALLHMHEGPFRGGLFELSLEMPSDYPSSGPVIKFVPPIRSHPNVDAETGQVSVPWRKSIALALGNVESLLKFPFVEHREMQVRNAVAATMWQRDRISFDDEAHKDARQSWLAKLKPSDWSDMVCDLVFPAKQVSREAQHEVFKKIALPAIEDHVTEKYTSNVTSIHMGKLDPKAERKRVQEDIIRRTKMNAKRQNLSAQLTGTLKILADLQNPRAAAVEWLEQELARLKGREGKKKRSQSPQTKFPPEVQTLFEGQIRPSNSEGCFKMLVSEAKEEAKRLGESMGHCMKKYEMLYARFASVKKIENFSGFL